MTATARKWSEKPPKIYGPNYTDAIFKPELFQESVPKMGDFLKRLHAVIPFDAIAGTGLSSFPLLGALGYTLNIPIIAVRKDDNETNHSGRRSTGAMAKRYVIVDDLISSGRTVANVIQKIYKQSKNDDTQVRPICVAVVLYNDNSHFLFNTGSDRWGGAIPVFNWGMTKIQMPTDIRSFGGHFRQ